MYITCVCVCVSVSVCMCLYVCICTYPAPPVMFVYVNKYKCTDIVGVDAETVDPERHIPEFPKRTGKKEQKKKRGRNSMTRSR